MQATRLLGIAPVLARGRRPAAAPPAALVVVRRTLVLLLFALALLLVLALLQSPGVLLLLLLEAAVLLGVLLQRPDEAVRDGLAVQKVAKAGPAARALVKVAAAGLAEVRDGTVLAVQKDAVVVAAVQIFEGVGGLLLVGELDVRVTDHVIADVVHDVEAAVFDATEFGELQIQIFIEDQEVFQRRGGVDGDGSRAIGMAVDVFDQNRGRKGGFVVQPTAPVSVPTCANLVVKGTVHLVLFGAVNAGQVFRHCL